jgi:aspartyl-tRNA(Asn)/glutamyl-tRNA(Gln) amidotransferase subunit A
MTQIADWTLTNTAAAIAARNVSALEVTEAALTRIAMRQPTLNAFVRIDAAGALAAAKAADQALAAGQSAGPLHGVPLAPRTCSIGPVSRSRAALPSAATSSRMSSPQCWRG